MINEWMELTDEYQHISSFNKNESFEYFAALEVLLLDYNADKEYGKLADAIYLAAFFADGIKYLYKTVQLIKAVVNDSRVSYSIDFFNSSARLL